LRYLGYPLLIAVHGNDIPKTSHHGSCGFQMLCTQYASVCVLHPITPVHGTKNTVFAASFCSTGSYPGYPIGPSVSSPTFHTNIHYFQKLWHSGMIVHERLTIRSKVTLFHQSKRSVSGWSSRSLLHSKTPPLSKNA
jgi:hypothetical protein